MLKSSIVAIVGRPNVGKSAFFNRLSEKKISIVDETVGVTRDRVFANCSWLNFKFKLIDTGGLDFKNNENKIEFLKEVKAQTQISIFQADVVVFVVDLHCGLTSLDLEIANLLRKSKKPVIVCVNKCDNVGTNPAEFFEFCSLGFKKMFAVSAIHGYGITDFLDCLVSFLPKKEETAISTDHLKIAIVGRPNVGKSSILNKILGENRVIVSDVAGTTRDSIDEEIENKNGNFVLIDTAGLVRKSNKISKVERYSLLRTYSAIDRADICLIVVDGFEGLLKSDVKIAGYVHEKGKGALILINKLDLIEQKEDLIKNFSKKLKTSLNFMKYFQELYVSAKTGQRLNKIFEIAKQIQVERTKRLSTGTLNSFLSFCTSKVAPPRVKGNQLKIYYITQTNVEPPTFVFFINKLECFHFSYKRYIENQIRLTFGFYGTPIKIIAKVHKEN